MTRNQSKGRAPLIHFVRVLTLGAAGILALVGSSNGCRGDENPGSSSQPDAKSPGTAQAWTLTDLQKVVDEEMSRIDQVVGFKTDVHIFEHANGIRTTSTGGIEVDESELRKILDNSDATQFREVVRLLLAHETGHQLQFRQYGQDCYKNADAQKRRIFECQADMLAGKYLIESMGGAANADSISDALRVMFAIGDPEHSAAANHPDHEGRRTAVRRGMAAGQITLFQSLPPTPQVLGSIQILADKINILPGESVMQWSYRQSSRIIHCDRTASMDIVFSEENIQWNPARQNPIVNYSIKYTNRGSRAIEGDLEFRCDWVDRINDHDTLKSLLWSTRDYHVTLQPGETKTASGTLAWGDPNGIPIAGINKLMPRFVSPPDDVALWSFTYVGGNDHPAEENHRAVAIGRGAGAGAGPDHADKRREENIKLILSTKDLRTLRAGPGQDVGDDTYYPCDPQLIQAGETTVDMDKDGSVQVNARRNFGADRDGATREFDSLLTDMKAATPDGTVTEVPPAPKRPVVREVRIKNANDDTIASMWIRVSKVGDNSGQRFDLSVWMSQPKEN